MNAYILSRETLTGHIVIGAYTSLALAEASRDTKIQAFVDAQNAKRDTDYAAGESFDALLTASDVLPRVSITTVVVDA